MNESYHSAMTAGRLPPRHLEVLRLIAGRLNDPHVKWAVTGSVAFLLRGIPWHTSIDLDIQTDEAGAYEIEKRLAEYCTRPVRLSMAERIRSHFGELQIGGVTVEIMGDIQHRLPDKRWSEASDIAAKREWVEVDDLRLPVLDLAYEAEAYERLGREEAAIRLRSWMEHRRC